MVHTSDGKKKLGKEGIKREGIKTAGNPRRGKVQNKTLAEKSGRQLENIGKKSCISDRKIKYVKKGKGNDPVK